MAASTPQSSTVQDGSLAKKTLTLNVTAYASVPEETDDTPFVTADGSYVHDGVVATNILPFGTKIMIPSLFGDKIFTVNDRMNKRFMNNVDVWMNSKAAAVVFGSQTAKVVVLQDDADIVAIAAANAVALATQVMAVSPKLQDLSVR